MKANSLINSAELLQTNTLDINNKLQVVDWMLIEDCNIACPYCMMENVNLTQDISRETAIKIAEYYLKKSFKRYIFSFTGGEATLHPYLKDLIHYIIFNKKETHIMLDTNGMRCSSYYKNILDGLPINSVDVSIYIHPHSATYNDSENCIKSIINMGQKCSVFVIQALDTFEVSNAFRHKLMDLCTEQPFDLYLHSVQDSKDFGSSGAWEKHPWFCTEAVVTSQIGTYLDKDILGTIEVSLPPKMESPGLPADLSWVGGELLISQKVMDNDPIAGVCLSISRSGLFDASWYLEQYPDVATAKMNAVLHYVLHGAKEGRDPTRWFSTEYYLHENIDVAEEGINPLYHYITSGYINGRSPRNWNYKANLAAVEANVFMQSNRFSEAIVKYNEAIQLAETEESTASWYAAQGECYLEVRQWEKAENALKRALLCQPENAKLYYQLALSMRPQGPGKWWQTVPAMKNAVRLDSGNADWWYKLGEAQETMERWAEAATAYEHAITLDGKWAEWHYKLGYVHQRNGLHMAAQKAYENAVRLDSSLHAKEVGIGAFHQKHGLWKEARNAYEEYLQRHLPGSGELHARLAVAHHRCHDMEKAAIANMNALVTPLLPISEETDTADTYYRIGITCERMEKFEEAAQAYACSRSVRENAYRCYRHGYALAQAGKYEEACLVYLQWPNAPALKKLLETKSNDEVDLDYAVTTIESLENRISRNEIEKTTSVMDVMQSKLLNQMAQAAVRHYSELLDNDTTCTEVYFQMGQYLEILGNPERASAIYAEGNARQSDHWPAGWFMYGRALTAAGRYEEACSAFASLERLRRPYWVDRGIYEKNIYFRRRADYLEYCEHLPVREDVILYESIKGDSIGGNPYAIFKFLHGNDSYKNFKHIWVVNDFSVIPNSLKRSETVIFIQRESDTYLKYLATAKLLVNDTAFQEYFIRRSEQLYVNTWHGTPLKTLGVDDFQNPLISYRDVQRNFLQATHIVSPNPHTTSVYINSYKINCIYNGIVAETGYPRIDITINMTDQDKKQLKNNLGIEQGKRVLLYAPTWRGTWGDFNINTDYINDVIETATTVAPDDIILFRAHHALEKMWKDKPSCYIVPQEVPTNEILAITDVLITDYSSICFDFMTTNKPIIYYVHDIEEYCNTRGLYINPDNLPGDVCKTLDELKIAISHANIASYKKKYEDALKTYCPNDDGRATERLIRLLFEENKKLNRIKNKISILFYVDFLKNGISTSFINLLNEIDKDKYIVTILIDQGFTLKTPYSLKLINALDKQFNIVPLEHKKNLTIEEHYILGQEHDFQHPETKEVFKRVYSREMRRLFGNTKFDVCIDYLFYSNSKTELFAFGGCKHNLVYMHNDMLREITEKFPLLNKNMLICNNFDFAISVSEAIADMNKNNLARKFAIDEHKFIALPNVQNPEEIRKLSEEAIAPQHRMFFYSNQIIFVNVGRLSPEKGQEKLIDAFEFVYRQYPQARLVIVGGGPEETVLRTQIRRLDMEKNVLLTGLQDNPYPYMAQASCFVSSSNYEGQPVVLFEALALDLPIIATDIPASKEVLGNGKFGLLVPNSVQDLADGMSRFIRDGIKAQKFDFHSYQKDALQKFDALIADLCTDKNHNTHNS